MKPDTKAIRALADECFRAPWKAETFVVKCDILEHAESGYKECDGEHEVERIESPDEYPDGQVVAEVPGMEMFSKHHAAFIAAARSDVPALCDRVEALEAALREAIELANEMDDDVGAAWETRMRSVRAVLEGE